RRSRAVPGGTSRIASGEAVRMSAAESPSRTPSLSAERRAGCAGRSLPRPIFAVASPANGSGKTSLAAGLVAALPGCSAIKFTTVRRDGSRCPRGSGGCACHSLQGDFSVLEEPEVILQPDTDTWRLATAGARRVLWFLARP